MSQSVFDLTCSLLLLIIELNAILTLSLASGKKLQRRNQRPLAILAKKNKLAKKCNLSAKCVNEKHIQVIPEMSCLKLHVYSYVYYVMVCS